MAQVENIALLSNAPQYGFVGVNMYVDDEGSIKELPVNLRASDIANCCAKPMEVGRPCCRRLFCHSGRRRCGLPGDTQIETAVLHDLGE